jgi:hypothetical protein
MRALRALRARDLAWLAAAAKRREARPFCTAEDVENIFQLAARLPARAGKNAFYVFD